MEYNKNQFEKVNDKKLLHKVGKQWVVLSTALLFAMSVGALHSVTTHASTNVNTHKQNTYSKKLAESESQNITPVNKQASQLHQQIIANQIHSKDYVNNINNNFLKVSQNHNNITKNNMNKNSYTNNQISSNNSNQVSNQHNKSLESNNSDTNNSRNLQSVSSANENLKSDVTPFSVSNNSTLATNENNSDIAAENDANKWEREGGSPTTNLSNSSQYGGTHNEHDYGNGTIVFSDGTFNGFGNYSYQHSDIKHLIFKNITFVGAGHAFAWLRNLQSVDMYGNIRTNNYYIDNDFFNDINLEYIHGLSKFLNDGNIGDYDFLFRNCKKLKYLDLSGLNTRHIPATGQYDFDPSDPRTSDGNFGAFAGMSDLSKVKLGNNTILYPSSQIPSDFFPSGNTIANGISKLDNGKPHPGVWNVIQASNIRSWGSAQCVQDRVGDLIIQGPGIITGNRNDASGIDWNSVKHIYTKGVKAPSNLDNTFAGLPNLVSFDGSGMDVSDVSDIDGAFGNDSNLQSLSGLHNWFNNQNNNLHSMNGAFMNDKSLETLEGLSDWNVDNVADYSGTDSFGFENEFSGDTGLSNILSLKNWNVTSTTCANGHSRRITLYHMFSNDTNIVEFELTNNFNFGNSSTRNTESSSSDDGTPDLPDSSDWVGSKYPDSEISNINIESTPDIYFNKKLSSKGTIVYKYGNQVLNTYKDWAPNHFNSRNLPGVPSGYEVDPRNPNQNYSLTNNGTTTIYLDKVGTWGSARWDLTPDNTENSDSVTKTYGAGNLYIHDGQLSHNSDVGMETNSITQLPEFRNIISNIKSINTNNLVAPSDSRNLFSGIPNLVSAQLNGINFFNTNQIHGILGADSKLINADLSDITVPNVNSISEMFVDDTSLRNINMNGFTANKTTSDSAMFMNDTHLKTLNLTGLETGVINTDSNTFTNDNKLRELIISGNNFRINSNANMPTAQAINKNNKNSQVVTLNDGNAHPGDWLIGQNVGKWGSASWILNKQGVLYVSDGVLSGGSHGIFDEPVALNNIGAPTSDITKVVIGNNVIAPRVSNYLFNNNGNYPKLQSFNVKRLDTSHVSDMEYLFGVNSPYHISKTPVLTTIKGLSDWNVSNVFDMIYMFSGLSHLQNIDLNNWNVQNVHWMDEMFESDSSLQSLDLSSFNTSHVTGMDEMFRGDSKLQSLDLSSFNTSHVTGMMYTFRSDSSLQSLDLSHFDTSNVTDMSGMFDGDSSLKSLDLSHFDTSNVTDMSWMFDGDSSLKSLDLSHFDTNNVTNIDNMFSSDSSLQSLILGNKFDTTRVSDSDISDIFSRDNNLNEIKIMSSDTRFPSDSGLPNTWYQITDFNNLKSTKYPVTVANLNDGKAHKGIWAKGDAMAVKFKDIYSDIDGLGSHVPKSTTIIGKTGSNHKITLNNSDWTLVDNTGKIINSDSVSLNSNNTTVDVAPKYKGLAFKYDKNNKSIEFTNGQLKGGFDDDHQFLGEKIDVPDSGPKDSVPKYIKLSDITSAKFDSDVDTSKVTNMNNMFYNDSSLTSLDVSHFDTSNVFDMSDMFENDSSLKSLDLSHFDTGKVTDMDEMFSYDSSLKSLDINHFDTNNVTDMGAMFLGDSSLQSLDVSHFNTGKVIYMNSMFSYDSSLKSLDLSHFDTSKVTNMLAMFKGDSSLQSLILGYKFNTTSFYNDWGIFNSDSIFTSDNNLNEIEIMSSDTRFYGDANLSDTWHQITDFNNLKSTKYPVNVININDGKAHKGIWAKGNISNTVKVNFINQNNANIGSTTVNSTNGTITWPTTTPANYGYFIDGGQETSHTFQASDVDSHGNLTKGDFNADGSHNIYVTGVKANLKIKFTNNGQLISSDDFNGTNAIGDTLSNIQIPKGYVPTPSLYNYNLSDNTFDYNFNPNNINTVQVNSDTAIMNSDNISLQPLKGLVNVRYVDGSDGKVIYRKIDSGFMGSNGQDLSLPSTHDLSNRYSPVDNQELNYVFKPSNIKSNSNVLKDYAVMKDGQVDYVPMNDYTVYVHRNNISQLKVIYLDSDGGQIGSPDVINGDIGDKLEILNHGDTPTNNPNAVSYAPSDCHINDESVILSNTTPTNLYVRADRNNITDTVNILQVIENSDGRNTVNSTKASFTGYRGESESLNANQFLSRIPSSANYEVNSDVDNSSNATVTLASDGETNPDNVIFYYRAKNLKNANLTVYLINHGRIIRKSNPIQGQLGKSISQDDIRNDIGNIPNGYTISNSAIPSSYTFTKSSNNMYINVTGEPVRNIQQFTIYQIERKLDGSINIVKSPITLSGNVGSDVLVTPYNNVPSGYHASNHNASLILHYNSDGILEPIHSIDYIYDQNYNPNASDNKIDKINIHYISSDAPYNGDANKVNIGGTQYYEVDAESDRGIQSDSFNVTPYLEDIPTSVNDNNYDFADKKIYNASGQQVDKSNIKYNGKQSDYYIKVTKTNNNNLIVLK